MKAYKGFNPDMTCMNFQYEEGKEYTHEGDIEMCHRGFHACEDPIDCLWYYTPGQSVYHEVELDEVAQERMGDPGKVCAKTIRIGARVSIAEMIKASIEYRMSKTTPVKGGRVRKHHGAASATGNGGAASATGNGGAASATGYGGAASATGYCGAASATGDHGAASATGYCGAASATGYCGAASATGNHGAASATGDHGAASATGNHGAASATGDHGAASATGNCGVALAAGSNCKAKGAVGCALCLIERRWNKGKGIYEIAACKAVIVDGKEVKADTWYMLKDGKMVEVE